MPSNNAPGVYVEEVRSLGRTISAVPTAIPVFIGYTQVVPATGVNVPVRIENPKDFFTLFGGEAPANLRQPTVHLNSAYRPSYVTYDLTYQLANAIRLFFTNGGGVAYIVSVGTYKTSAPYALEAELTDAISALETIDEPSLVVVPDAYILASANMGNVHKAVLAHCNTMKDRFGIMDVQDSGAVTTDADNFRTGVGEAYLSYGAGYYPSIKTSIGTIQEYSYSAIAMKNAAGANLTIGGLAAGTGDPYLLSFDGASSDSGEIVDQGDIDDALSNFSGALPVTDQAGVGTLLNETKLLLDMILGIDTGNLVSPILIGMLDEERAVDGPINTLIQTLLDIDTGWDFVDGPSTVIGEIVIGTYNTQYPNLQVATSLPAIFSGATTPAAAITAIMPSLQGAIDQLAAFAQELRDLNAAFALDSTLTNNPIFARIMQAANQGGYTLPPSGAVAGIYNRVDANRGVWKAPANESLNMVSESTQRFTQADLEGLNIPSNGKSINAIRNFRGRGTLVYGARTLDGSSGEWKFINVRRTFIMIEESISKALQFSVFEGNTAQTWVQVKTMIENFLTGVWRQGALAGATPKEAFQVKVGLGSTMTEQDILNGRLIVEVAVAAVRPAEFIVLEFSHKLQTS